MNFGTIKTRLALNAGNLQSSHPQYAYLNNYANDGLRLMISRASAKFPNYQLFPEHKDVEWTDVTVADQNYLSLPSDHIAIQRAFSLDSSTAPNMSNAGWRLLSYVDPKAFDQLSKPTTDLQYPAVYTVREGRIYFHPTPRATKTTYVKIDGIEDEPDMSSSSDTPRTNIRWHPAWLDFASYLLLTDMGWDDDAKRFLAAGDEKIAIVGASMVGLRLANINKRIRIVGGF